MTRNDCRVALASGGVRGHDFAVCNDRARKGSMVAASAHSDRQVDQGRE